MALQLRPHTFTIAPVTIEDSGEGSAGTPTFGAAVTLLGQITPLSQDAAFRITGVELSRPHRVMVNEADASYLTVGAKVTFGSRTFIVRTPPEIWNAESTTSYASAVIEEEEDAGV